MTNLKERAKNALKRFNEALNAEADENQIIKDLKRLERLEKSYADLMRLCNDYVQMLKQAKEATAAADERAKRAAARADELHGALSVAYAYITRRGLMKDFCRYAETAKGDQYAETVSLLAAHAKRQAHQRNRNAPKYSKPNYKELERTNESLRAYLLERGLLVDWAKNNTSSKGRA